jgi:hypothetical protein
VIPHRLKGCQKITIELTLTGRGVAITQNGEKDMAEKWEQISFFTNKGKKKHWLRNSQPVHHFKEVSDSILFNESANI